MEARGANLGVHPFEANGGPIVFFDGTCGLCNRVVNFLLRGDRRAALRFAPLQGALARRVLPEAMTRELGSVVLLDEYGLHTRSEAIRRCLSFLDRWSWLSIAVGWVPLSLRDRAYDFVAGRRRRWFGQLDQCRIPTPDERSRFLE